MIIKLAGVYEIRNTVNDHLYIGSSLNLSKRLCGHKNALRKCAHRNPHLQSAYDKYGESNFIFQPLLYCDPNNVLLYEQMFIDGLKPEYNISPTAGNTTGCILGSEARKKMSAAKKGKRFTKEHRNKISKANMGHEQTCFVYSDERNKKISLALAGRSFSEETRQKMSEVQKRPRPWAIGKRRSEETCQKISKSRVGMKSAFLGHKHSEETKQKMKAAWVLRREKHLQPS